MTSVKVGLRIAYLILFCTQCLSILHVLHNCMLDHHACLVYIWWIQCTLCVMYKANITPDTDKATICICSSYETLHFQCIVNATHAKYLHFGWIKPFLRAAFYSLMQKLRWVATLSAIAKTLVFHDKEVVTTLYFIIPYKKNIECR